MKTQKNISIWRKPAYNARGQITTYNLGDDYEATRNWDSYGFPSQIKTKLSGASTYIDYLYFDFDEKRGNLMQRDTWKYYKFEKFRYDELNRLVADSLSSSDYRNTQYAANGNITMRSDVGDYSYSGLDAGPHAFTGITNPVSGQLPLQNQSVDYTAFNKVSHISQGDYDYFITYGPDRLRRRSVLLCANTDATVQTKYYLFGDYEKDITQSGTRHLHYISAGDGLAAIWVKYDSGADTLFYVMKDHLGSIVGAINSESGEIHRQSFDAWGRNRNPENWTYSNVPDFIFDRGFTGHEHLKWFGLINMLSEAKSRSEAFAGNGRMYDAALCRFLSPDPFVQMPDYSQNFNRYSYALNNPLVYTDPNGEFIFSALIPVFGVFIDAACWGAVLGGAGYTASVGFSDGGFNNWDWGQFGKSVGIGAISGMATAGIGSAFGAVGSGGLTGEIARAYVHGFSQGTISQLSGGDFLSGFAAGGLGSFGGSAFQMFGGKFAHSAIGTTSFSALSGGVGAELSGGNFWQGAATGATIGMLNHGAQLVQNDITRRMGKFVNSREEGLNYIYNNSPVEGKEMGMVEYVTARDKTRYFVTPWNKNTSNDTYFDYSKMPKGFGTAVSKIRYHTHLSNNGPSYADFYNHSSNRNWSRSLVISRSSVWDVNRYHSPVPPRGIPTGRWLSPVSEWLKGNFINF